MSDCTDFIQALSLSTNGINIISSTAEEIKQHISDKNTFLVKENIVNKKSIEKFFSSNDYKKAEQAIYRKAKLLERLRKKLKEKKATE